MLHPYRFINLNFEIIISIKLRAEKDFCTTVLLICFPRKSYRKIKVVYFASTGSHKPFYDAQ